MDLFEEEQQVYDNAEDHIKAVDAGEAYDFERFRTLAKEYRIILKQLRRMTKFSDRTTVDLNESNLDLIDKVHYDTLTGIYSRCFMEESLERDVRALVCSGGVLSIMITDIDFFKKFNDTYGHSAGDDCLKAVAKALADCVTQSGDFVARYGGEEFVIVLPNTDEASAIVIAEKILDTVRGLGIPHEKNEAASCVTVSVGATTLKPKPDEKFADYIKRADVALYESKQNGRNRYTYIMYEEDSE